MKAHDFIADINKDKIALVKLKTLLRQTQGNAYITFSDKSVIKFEHTDSWRTDRLYVETE